jgi:hypothetical protein
MVTPYLKGIHLTLDSWRPWRKTDGWKLTLGEIRAMLEEKGQDIGGALGSGNKAPDKVTCVPRLKDDIRALKLFMSSSKPPKRVVLPSREAKVVYSFGDASGIGFGSSFKVQDEIHYTSGQWNEEHGQKSSNFRELANLTYCLEKAHTDGLLCNSEAFIFTDNSTAEAAFFKGTSKSKDLFELTLRLHNLHMHGEIILHLIHIAGKTMINQGTDGLSRGLPVELTLINDNPLYQVPLHLWSIERQPHPLSEWVESWLGCYGSVTWLSSEDWYTKGHQDEHCVWSPPPAAADAALEQLAKSVHKRPHHTHVVMIPRLMTA